VRWLLALPLIWGMGILGAPVPSYADEPVPGSSMQVLQGFGNQEEGGVLSIPDKRRHEVLFLMGISLLILILTTGGLGLAMGVFGKDLFVPHMLFAGLSVTLAIAHAITAIVWFYPF